MPPSPVSALPPRVNTQRCTSMHFGENQLSRGLISLSLLPSAHPRIFQHSPVRSSTQYHLRFNLAKGRSPPLRVQHMQLLFALFGLAFASPASQKDLSLLHILTRRLIKQKARHHRFIFTEGKNWLSVKGYWLLVIGILWRFAPLNLTNNF